MNSQNVVEQVTAAAAKVDAHAVKLAEILATVEALESALASAKAELVALAGGQPVAPDVEMALKKLSVAVAKTETVLEAKPPVQETAPVGSTNWTWRALAKEGAKFAITGAPRYVRFGWGGVRWIMKLVQGEGVASSEFFGGDPFIGVSKSVQVYVPSDRNTTDTTPVPEDWIEKMATSRGMRWEVAAKEGETFTASAQAPQAEGMVYGVDGRFIWAGVPPGTWTCSPAMFDADPAFGNANKVCKRMVAA